MLFKVCLNSDFENYEFVDINSLEDLKRLQYYCLSRLGLEESVFDCRLMVDFINMTISVYDTYYE